MSNELFSPIIVNSVIFYLIGLFLIFYIVKFHLLTLPGSLQETGYKIHNGIKLLLFIFCALFTTIFFDFYRSPFLNIVPTISLLGSQILFVIFYVLISILLYYVSNSVLTERGYETNWILKLIVSVGSLSLTIFFFSANSYFNTIKTNQLADLGKFLLLIVLASILYVLLLKILRLLMNNNRDFDREAKKTKYALFILIILVCFTIFSYSTASLVQSTNQESLVGNFQFSPNLEKVAFKISNENTGATHLVVKDLQTGISNVYLASPDETYVFYNSSMMYSISSSTIPPVDVNSLNLNTGKVNSLYTYHNQPYVNNWTRMVYNYLEINSKIINTSQSMETLILKNLVTQEVFNTSLKVPEEFSLNNKSFSDYFFENAPLYFSQDLTKLVLYSPGQNMYFYSLTNNSIAQLQSTIHYGFKMFDPYFHFIKSDSSNMVFFQYANQIYDYNYSNHLVNHIGTITNYVHSVSSKEQLLFSDNIYTFKTGNITLTKSLLYQQNELDVISHDSTTSTANQKTVVYSPWLPDIEVLWQTIIFWLALIGTIILVVQSIRYVNNENLIYIY